MFFSVLSVAKMTLARGQIKTKPAVLAGQVRFYLMMPSFLPASPMTSIARSISLGSCAAVTVARNLANPSGTAGETTGRTKTSFNCASRVMAKIDGGPRVGLLCDRRLGEHRVETHAFESADELLRI